MTIIGKRRAAQVVAATALEKLKAPAAEGAASPMASPPSNEAVGDAIEGALRELCSK